MNYPQPLSVQSYDEAKYWLWCHARPHEWLDRKPSDLPDVAKLVCAIFWVSEKQLLKDLRKRWREVMKPDRPQPHRRTRHGWYR